MTVIAMTREIGSRGTDVAAGLAAQLGLEIINSEIVVPDVAGSLGVEQGVVQRYLDGKASLFDRWQVDKRKLSRYTLNQVLNLSMKDNVLIRGWGAAALFQGIRGILCVRVCAPMAERVRVMMERLAMKDAAEGVIGAIGRPMLVAPCASVAEFETVDRHGQPGRREPLHEQVRIGVSAEEELA